MRCNALLPIYDYLQTRKKLWIKYFVAGIPALCVLGYALAFNARDGINIVEAFDSFVNIQISAVAILISFSIAIITILVTSDNENVHRLRRTPASEKNYKSLKNGAQLTLFQVLLSNISYNIITQVLYLLLLIVEVFLKMIVPIGAFKYMCMINVFFITHILFVLVESVVNMYLVFWKDYSKKQGLDKKPTK